MFKAQSDTPTTEMQCHSALNALSFEDTLFLTDIVIGPDDGDPPVKPEKLMLKYNFEFILQKVNGMLCSLVKREERSLFDVEDIADEVYIHFWEILEDKERAPIRYPAAYLATMIHHKLCDEIRKHVRHGCPQPFSVLPGGTFQEEKALLSWSYGMSDPALEYERKQRDAHFLHKFAYAVSKLPPRQKLAMTCELLEKVDNLAWMTAALTIYGVNTQVHWPTDKKAKQGLQANLSAARQAVAQCLYIDITALPTKRHAC